MPRKSSHTEGKEDDQLKAIHGVVNETWKNLDHLWNRMGHDPPVMLKRKSIVHKHVKDMLTEMVEEEGNRVREKEVHVKNQVKEVEQLSEELKLDGSLVAQAKDAGMAKPLLQAEILYAEVLMDLRRRKEIRMEKYNVINDKVIELSEEMGEKPMQIEFNGIPSDNQVAKLDQHLSHLTKEKQKRQATFKRLKKSITHLLDCVERIPSTDLEKLICSSEDLKDNTSEKILSLKVLHAMEEMEADFKNQIQLNVEESERLWQKIRELWSRLSIEEEIQYSFENVHRSVEKVVGDKKKPIYTPSILKGLHAELNRLEEEKRRNMELFINQVRDELVEVWTTKCFMTQVNMRFEHPNYAKVTSFDQDDFTSDLYSEELLTKHETEVEFWRQFAERNQKIIDLILKRRNMFAQYQELDFKSDDPARLANRGGALLKEEKQRKMLLKAIPKLEKELRELSSQFTDSRDSGFQMKMFLVHGISIDDMIEQEWSEFHEEKERRKESRKTNGNATSAPGAMGKTMMSNHGNTNQGTMSRKRPATPSSQRVCMNTPIKRNKLAPTTPIRTPSTLKKYPSTAAKMGATGDDGFARPATRSKVATLPSRMAAGSRIPSRAGSRCGKEQIAPLPIENDVLVSPVNSYSEFTDHLLCQSTLNSSTVSTVAKNRNPLKVVPSTDVGSQPVTPTKSDRHGLAFTPAKRPTQEYF